MDKGSHPVKYLSEEKFAVAVNFSVCIINVGGCGVCAM
jgi:hypothetical protein